MFDKNLGKKVYTGKGSFFKKIKPSPITCNECGKSIFLKGKTHFTCNCKDCPCTGDNQEVVNNVGPPPNCSSVIRYILERSSVPDPGGFVGIDTINAVGQTAVINLGSINFGVEPSVVLQLFDISGSSGDITVNTISITGDTIGSTLITTLPGTFVNGGTEDLISISLVNNVSGDYSFEVVIDTDCGDITITFNYTIT